MTSSTSNTAELTPASIIDRLLQYVIEDTYGDEPPKSFQTINNLGGTENEALRQMNDDSNEVKVINSINNKETLSGDTLKSSLRKMGLSALLGKTNSPDMMSLYNKLTGEEETAVFSKPVLAPTSEVNSPKQKSNNQPHKPTHVRINSKVLPRPITYEYDHVSDETSNRDWTSSKLTNTHNQNPNNAFWSKPKPIPNIYTQIMPSPDIPYPVSQQTTNIKIKSPYDDIIPQNARPANIANINYQHHSFINPPPSETMATNNDNIAPSANTATSGWQSQGYFLSPENQFKYDTYRRDNFPKPNTYGYLGDAPMSTVLDFTQNFPNSLKRRRRDQKEWDHGILKSFDDKNNSNFLDNGLDQVENKTSFSNSTLSTTSRNSSVTHDDYIDLFNSEDEESVDQQATPAKLDPVKMLLELEDIYLRPYHKKTVHNRTEDQQKKKRRDVFTLDIEPFTKNDGIVDTLGRRRREAIDVSDDDGEEMLNILGTAEIAELESPNNKNGSPNSPKRIVSITARPSKISVVKHNRNLVSNRENIETTSHRIYPTFKLSKNHDHNRHRHSKKQQTTESAIKALLNGKKETLQSPSKQKDVNFMSLKRPFLETKFEELNGDSLKLQSAKVISQGSANISKDYAAFSNSIVHTNVSIEKCKSGKEKDCNYLTIPDDNVDRFHSKPDSKVVQELQMPEPTKSLFPSEIHPTLILHHSTKPIPPSPDFDYDDDIEPEVFQTTPRPPVVKIVKKPKVHVSTQNKIKVVSKKPRPEISITVLNKTVVTIGNHTVHPPDTTPSTTAAATTTTSNTTKTTPATSTTATPTTTTTAITSTTSSTATPTTATITSTTTTTHKSKPADIVEIDIEVNKHNATTTTPTPHLKENDLFIYEKEGGKEQYAPMFGGDIMLAIDISEELVKYIHRDNEVSLQEIEEFLQASSAVLDERNKMEWKHAVRVSSTFLNFYYMKSSVKT